MDANESKPPECLVSDYFSLEGVEHAGIFSNVNLVWDAVGNLKPYIDGFENWAIKSDIPAHCTLSNTDLIYIGKNVTIDPYACIMGPCIIEDGVHIGPHSFIRSYSIIGRGAKVGHCSEVKVSFLFPDCKLPHFNYVGDSIIGSRVGLGAGVICANLKLNQSDVVIYKDGMKWPTNRRKLGAVIGDDTSIGCHVVLNPGSIIPPQSKILKSISRNKR